jgi:Family of unknown function (DUF5522)
MKSKTIIKPEEKPEKFTEGIDFYFEKGLMILTATFLLGRGFCCDNNCRNCPYEKKGEKILQ